MIIDKEILISILHTVLWIVANVYIWLMIICAVIVTIGKIYEWITDRKGEPDETD